ITTSSGIGFNATGGGTVNVTTGTNANSITTTTGTALNVVNTSIGGNGMTFYSINSGTSSTGPTNAIVLNSTGSSGGLTVTGDGTANQNGSGGTIQHTTGDSVSLTSTTNVVLQRMHINNSGGNGIYGTNAVNGFALDWASMSNNGTSGEEDAVRFGSELTASSGLTGSGPTGPNPTRISNSTLVGSYERNVSMFSSQGTLTELDVQNSSFQNAHNGSGFLIETRTSAVATVIVSGSTFSSNFSVGLQGSALPTSNLTLEVLGSSSANTFTNNNDGVLCSNDDGATATCTISGNTFVGQPGNSIFVGNGSDLTTAGSLNARVENNTITQPNTGNNNSIEAYLSGKGTVSNVLINNNTVSNNGQFDGINVNTPDSGSTPTLNVTLTNNKVTTAASGANGIDLTPHQSATACFNVTGNNATTNASGLLGIFLAQFGSATVTLEQGSSSSTDPTTVLNANNTSVPAAQATGTITVSSTARCSTPP
ncbi:MAG: hypothetical protein JO057_17900, partial [Chloroflexi bacterium]|nr:hypothetical protein [Chloroflexota bacterium]